MTNNRTRQWVLPVTFPRAAVGWGFQWIEGVLKAIRCSGGDSRMLVEAPQRTGASTNSSSFPRKPYEKGNSSGAVAPLW